MVKTGHPVEHQGRGHSIRVARQARLFGRDDCRSWQGKGNRADAASKVVLYGWTVPHLLELLLTDVMTRNDMRRGPIVTAHVEGDLVKATFKFSKQPKTSLAVILAIILYDETVSNSESGFRASCSPFLIVLSSLDGSHLTRPGSKYGIEYSNKPFQVVRRAGDLSLQTSPLTASLKCMIMSFVIRLAAAG